MCGEPGVGKTSLVRMFVVGKYDEKYLSTLGTAVSKKTVKVAERDCIMNMMVWDISGQVEFKRIHASAFSNSAGGLIIYDVTRPETLEKVKDWIATLKRWAGDSVPIIIIGNKVDLLPESELPAKGEMLGYPFIPTSAKNGANVDDAFTSLAQTIAISKEKIIEPVPSMDVKILPTKFENPGELLDYMAMTLCHTLQDQEMGMHILRKQVSDQGIDFHRMRRKEAEGLVDKLGDVVKEFKGPRDASNIKLTMIKAIDRTKW